MHADVVMLAASTSGDELESAMRVDEARTRLASNAATLGVADMLMMDTILSFQNRMNK